MRYSLILADRHGTVIARYSLVSKKSSEDGDLDDFYVRNEHERWHLGADILNEIKRWEQKGSE